jgi:hypothetical protein
MNATVFLYISFSIIPIIAAHRMMPRDVVEICYRSEHGSIIEDDLSAVGFDGADIISKDDLSAVLDGADITSDGDLSAAIGHGAAGINVGDLSASVVDEDQ